MAKTSPIPAPDWPRRRAFPWALGPPLAAALALASRGVAAGHPDYRISVDPGLRALSVRACFPDRLPPRLAASDADSAPYLNAATLERDGRTQTLATGEAHLDLPPAEGPGCVRYRIDLGAALTDTWRARAGGPWMRSWSRPTCSSGRPPRG